MPRLRVDPATSEAEIHEFMLEAIAAGHVLESQLADRRLCDPEKRKDIERAITLIGEELERLTGIMLRRRAARIPADAA